MPTMPASIATGRAARRQRGTTLLEALVALLVLALGMFSVARVQTQLRLNADNARQRSEAVRLAQEDIERLRAFSVVEATAGARAYADIVTASSSIDAATDVPGFSSTTRYTLTRNVSDAQAPRARNASVSVAWTDRGGSAHEVTLSSVIAGSNPAYTGALTVGAAPAAIAPVNARSMQIPRFAKDLGNGRSAFKPVAGGSLALLMDNASGAVVARCPSVSVALATQDLTLANLTGCIAQSGQLLSGVVRFAAGGPPVAGAANEVPLAVALSLALSGAAPATPPQCSSDAVKAVSVAGPWGARVMTVPLVATPAAFGLVQWVDTGDRHVAYHCVVVPTSAANTWSGRLTLVPTGWSIGTGALDHRVCRYSADLDGSGAIDTNAEHPDAYANVQGALAHQNFLVIQGSQSCPTGTAVRMDGASAPVFADLSTVQHQP
jgi:type IV pilus modification protein PilV